MDRGDDIIRVPLSPALWPPEPAIHVRNLLGRLVAMRLGTSTTRYLATMLAAVAGLIISAFVIPGSLRRLQAVETPPESPATPSSAVTPEEVTPDETTDTQKREFFETKIRPVLAEHCYECHSRKSQKVKAGLLVDSREDLLKGGDSGPAIVAGHADESLLIAAVKHESFEMPPSGKLGDEQISDLARWIQEGAWWPEEEAAARAEARERLDPEAERAARRASHWSWKPIVAHTVPEVANKDWPDQPADRFILAALESNGLSPAADADRATWIRRVTFDLTGLPPTPGEVADFVQDIRPDAYHRVVDRLLSSPAFGEKWARHWLDLVRYAETCGHEFDYPIRHADGYRDYVIRAWNDDVSYDQWVREHVAGDLLQDPRQDAASGLNESIRGTGFWWLGEANHAPTDVRADEADRMDNQLSVFGKTFLGLTIGCARCHDHKFDPISAADYYALAGFLQSSRRQEALLDPHGQIALQRNQIEQERHRIDESARKWIASELATPEYWTAQLLALADPSTESNVITSSSGSSEARATRELLDRWRAAFAAPNRASLAQPLQLWQECLSLVSSQGRHPELAPVRKSWLERASQYDHAVQQAQPFVDFRQDSLSGWFITGQALRAATSLGSRVEQVLESGQPIWSKPGTIDSGAIAGKLQGVLRSPTFTIQHRYIHHYLRGRGVHVRLVVDGYMMNEFSALLFADHMLKDINTDGQWRWVTQHHDLEHYLGHKAHLEYIDHGDGEWALQTVLFSNESAPPSPIDSAIRDWISASATSEKARDSQEIHGIDSVATHLGRCIYEALRAVSENRATGEQTDLVNSLLHHKILMPETDASWSAAWQHVQAASASIPAPHLALASTDGTSENEFLQIRGNARNLGPEIPRRLLTAIAGDNQSPITVGSGRLELAERMLADENPFVARVIVNRLWQHLFGRGLVASVDDFGAMGQPPSHPELLDYLSHDLRTHGWSMKRTLRQLVLSRTYRQSSDRRDPVAESTDPENRYWHRAEVKRLSAESLRDAILALSGRLDRTIGGSSVPVYLTDFMTARGQPASGPLDGAGRRSIYTKVQRNFPSSMMLIFDAPTPFGTVGRRSQSNVPAQSLVLMNDPFVWSQAELWSQRLRQMHGDTRQRLESAAQTAWSRSLTNREQEVFMKFIDAQCQELGINKDAPELWTDVGHMFLNTKEFLYVY